MPQIVKKNLEENTELRQGVADFIQEYYELKEEEGREYAAWTEFKSETLPGLQPRDRVEDIVGKFTQMKAKSPSMIRPGQMLLLNYKKTGGKKTYLVVVVGTKRGAFGTFTARTTKNKLISCFAVSDVSSYILASIMNAIYDEYDPQKLEYSKLVNEKKNKSFREETNIDQEGLQAAMSSATFKTFILSHRMTTMYEIQLDG